MTIAEQTNVAKVLSRAKELIERNRQAMVREGRIDDEIAMTHRVAKANEYFRQSGVDMDCLPIHSDGPRGFLAILRP